MSASQPRFAKVIGASALSMALYLVALVVTGRVLGGMEPGGGVQAAIDMGAAVMVGLMWLPFMATLARYIRSVDEFVRAQHVPALVSTLGYGLVFIAILAAQHGIDGVRGLDASSSAGAVFVGLPIGLIIYYLITVSVMMRRADAPA